MDEYNRGPSKISRALWTPTKNKMAGKSAASAKIIAVQQPSLHKRGSNQTKLHSSVEQFQTFESLFPVASEPRKTFKLIDNNGIFNSNCASTFPVNSNQKVVGIIGTSQSGKSTLSSYLSDPTNIPTEYTETTGVDLNICPVDGLVILDSHAVQMQENGEFSECTFRNMLFLMLVSNLVIFCGDSVESMKYLQKVHRKCVHFLRLKNLSESLAKGMCILNRCERISCKDNSSKAGIFDLNIEQDESWVSPFKIPKAPKLRESKVASDEEMFSYLQCAFPFDQCLDLFVGTTLREIYLTRKISRKESNWIDLAFELWTEVQFNV